MVDDTTTQTNSQTYTIQSLSPTIPLKQVYQKTTTSSSPQQPANDSLPTTVAIPSLVKPSVSTLNTTLISLQTTTALIT